MASFLKSSQYKALESTGQQLSTDSSRLYFRFLLIVISAVKNLFSLLFIALLFGSFSDATGQSRPKIKAKRAFNHSSEAGKGRNDKAHFRKESVRPVIDLNPHSLEKFKTAKANHHYKFSKPH